MTGFKVVIGIREFVRGRDRWRLAAAGVLTAAMAFVIAQPPVLIGRMVDRAARHASAGGALLGFLSVLAVCFVSRPLLERSRRRLVETVSASAGVEARAAVLRAVLEAEGVDAEPAVVNGRIGRGTEGVARLVKVGGADAAGVGLQIVVTLATAAAATSPAAFAATVAVVPVFLGVTALQLKFEGGVRHGLETDRVLLDAAQQNILVGGNVVRASGAIGQESARLTLIGRMLAQRSVRHHVRMAGWDVAKGVVEGGAQLAVAAIGAWALWHGHGSAGAVLASVALQQQILTPLREVHRILDEGHQATVQAGELLRFRQAAPLPRYASDSRLRPIERPITHAVVFTSVMVGGSGGGARPILDGVSFAVLTGEKVALVGPSGSGKSTVLRIAAGLIRPGSGRVVVAGLDLAHAADAELVATIGYVSQQPYVRPGTLLDNLLLGFDHPGDSAIYEVLDQVGLVAEIAAHGGLLEATVEQLNDGTWNWSGGQLQRIALARTMLRHPRVLLLDEPTSGLDADNAAAVWRLVQEWEGTVVAVTHANPEGWADRVITLVAGKIAETSRAA